MVVGLMFAKQDASAAMIDASMRDVQRPRVRPRPSTATGVAPGLVAWVPAPSLTPKPQEAGPPNAQHGCELKLRRSLTGSVRRALGAWSLRRGSLAPRRQLIYPRGVRFDEKARENIEAAERLLPDDYGERDALSNAAASRAYYGAYLAVADRAQMDGREMTSADGTWYRHDRLPGDARDWGILSYDDAEVLGWLHGLRVKADYWEDHVCLEEASQALDEGKRIALTLLGEGAGS